MTSLLSLFSLINLAICTPRSKDVTVAIHSSCNNINSDGLYYIKPTSEGPVIPVLCSNGYAMLDISLDPYLKSYPSYLTSYTYSASSYHWILPKLDDESSFKEWWTPSDDSTQFRIAQSCSSCESSIDFGDDVVYYADSTLFCSSTTKTPGCPVELNDYACNICDAGDDIDASDSSSRTWMGCTALQMKSNTPINYNHDYCTAHNLVYRPVMSLTRDACTCYRPSTSKIYHVSSDELPAVTMNEDTQSNIAYIDDLIVFVDEDEDEDNDECGENVVYLKNSDFLYGTYRIDKCGEYILSQDIILNFNAPNQDINMNDDTFSPNSIDIDDLYWFPTHKQEKEGLYKGPYSYVGSYSLGFFAGITVEANNVKINLNGFTLRMHPLFYFQQRYFTLIECGAKYFVPGQGPSHWSMDQSFYAKNLEIFGGTLGLSSHHGIHGLRVEDLYIHDIKVRKFDVAGIQCNGCNNVKIESAVVGPLNTDIPVLGRYTHARAMLPRLQQLQDEYGSEHIKFHNRERVTVSSLIDRLIFQMDMIYHHYINEIEYDSDDTEWIAAQKLFCNPSGWMDGGSSYGIVFNGDGAAVVGIGRRIDGTSSIIMNNVEIFGVYNAVIEKIKFQNDEGIVSRLMLFDTLDWVAVTDSLNDGATAQYIGDAFTDIIFAINRYITSWYYLNSLYVSSAMEQYVFDGNNEDNNAFRGIFGGGSPADNDQNAGGCNTDIQLHNSKGAIGLRVDGVQNIAIDNLYIHDVVNWADLGANWCGEYWGPDGAAPDAEEVKITYGYTGTRAHGLIMDYASGSIKNVQIENILSLNGEAIAVNVYKGSQVDISQIVVDGVKAGTQLSRDDVNQLSLPNLIPNACAVQIHDDTECQVNGVTQSNIIGYSICDNDNQDIMLLSQLQYRSTGFNSIHIALVVLVVFVVCIIKRYLYSESDDVKVDNVRISNEHTPLLV